VAWLFTRGFYAKFNGVKCCRYVHNDSLGVKFPFLHKGMIGINFPFWHKGNICHFTPKYVWPWLVDFKVCPAFPRWATQVDDLYFQISNEPVLGSTHIGYNSHGLLCLIVQLPWNKECTKKIHEDVNKVISILCVSSSRLSQAHTNQYVASMGMRLVLVHAQMD